MTHSRRPSIRAAIAALGLAWLAAADTGAQGTQADPGRQPDLQGTGRFDSTPFEGARRSRSVLTAAPATRPTSAAGCRPH
jgi:hypothetical protein